jgi:hypothetical protein
MKMICSPLPDSLPTWVDPVPLTIFGLPPRDPNDEDEEEDEEDEDLEPPVVREPDE